MARGQAGHPRASQGSHTCAGYLVIVEVFALQQPGSLHVRPDTITHNARHWYGQRQYNSIGAPVIWTTVAQDKLHKDWAPEDTQSLCGS